MEIIKEDLSRELLFNIWVTTACNYVCSYCYEGDQKPQNCLDYITADKIIQFIPRIAKDHGADIVRVNFHGGEPTLNFGIIKYIVVALRKNKNINLRTSMTTNCFMFVQKIEQYIDELSVSIDGNKDTHDSNRKTKKGEGTFDISFPNALRYLESHPRVNLNMVVTPSSACELYENVMFFIHKGFKHISPNIDYFDSGWNDELFASLYSQLKKIKEIYGQLGKDISISIFDWRIGKKERCVVGKDHFQIYIDGNLYPCSVAVGEQKYCFGNVDDGMDKKKVDELNNLMENVVPECVGCRFYSYCTTCRCYFINEKLTGSMYQASGVICATEHLRIQLK